MRNRFVGGPNAGQVYLSTDLVNDRELSESIPFEDYQAGPAYTMSDGEEARDWKFRTTSKESKMSDTSASTSGDSTSTSTGNASSTVAGDGTQDQVAAPEIANPSSNYEERRKAIKGASRAKLAEASGLTQSAIWRIETKGSDKQQELDMYEAGLQKLGQN